VRVIGATTMGFLAVSGTQARAPQTA